MDPKVIEFNARLGTTETQSSCLVDFAQNITDILDKEPAITWTDKDGSTGRGCFGLKRLSTRLWGCQASSQTEGDIVTYYAGAKFAENLPKTSLSNGGRVYMLADRYRQRQNIIYNKLNKQNTEGLFFTEKDIGNRQ